MASSNLTKHGDEIIKRVKAPLGGEKLVASFQFQRFLDELGEIVLLSDDDNSQGVASLLTVVSKNRSLISGLSRELKVFLQELQDSSQEVQSLRAENSKLSALIQEQSEDFKNLEQLAVL